MFSSSERAQAGVVRVTSSALPSASVTWSVAPGSSSPVTMSALEMETCGLSEFTSVPRSMVAPSRYTLTSNAGMSSRSAFASQGCSSTM